MDQIRQNKKLWEKITYFLAQNESGSINKSLYVRILGNILPIFDHCVSRTSRRRSVGRKLPSICICYDSLSVPWDLSSVLNEWNIEPDDARHFSFSFLAAKKKKENDREIFTLGMKISWFFAEGRIQQCIDRLTSSQ